MSVRMLFKLMSRNISLKETGLQQKPQPPLTYAVLSLEAKEAEIVYFIYRKTYPLC